MIEVPPQIGPATFVVGAERSGSTLLRLMLDAHPELAFRYEFEIAVDAMPDDTHWPELEDYYEYLRVKRFAHERPVIDRALDYPSLVRSFLEQKRVADGKPYVGATVHSHFDRLLRIWPDARFVHLVRDGRDVAMSCVQMGWYGNVWTAAERWLETEQLWDRMTELVPPARRLEVTFEELASDPVSVLKRICKFMAIAYHPAMLEYPNHSSYALPSPRHAFKWPRELEPMQIQLLESLMAEMLISRGYGLSGFVPLEPTSFERALLKVDNRIGVARARIRSLGPKLWLESVVANRVGSKAWRESALLRIHSAINAQLQ